MPIDKKAFFQQINYKPHEGQLRLHTSTARFRLLACGARWGKSTAASREAMCATLVPDSLGWVVAPNYDLAGIIFGEILRTWQKVRPDFIENYSETRQTIRFVNGAEVYGKSAENPDSLLGRGLDWLIFDECAPVKESIWQEYLQARLIDRQGWALFTSTPKGKGWLWHLFMKGKNKEPGYYSQEGPTWENPAINKEQLLAQKPNWTSRYWQQEVLGAFLDDGGSVFREPRKHISGGFEEPKIGEGYTMGADLAKHRDWTVFTVMDSRGHVVYWDRLPQETNWPQQKMRIAELSKRYNRATAFIDCSGIGDPILDDLKSMSVPVKGVPTAQEKTLLIDALTVAMDNGRISYPEIPVLLGELETFEHELTATGRDRYNAPEGFHDDAVISLALAWRGISSHRPLIIAGGSKKKQAEGSLDYMLAHYFQKVSM